MTYKIQIDDEVRDATPDEIEAIEAREVIDEVSVQVAKDAAKVSAIGKLAALGLTEDEAKAIIG